MNILFSLPPIDGWVRAAHYLDYNGFALDETRIFDSFARSHPDLFITFSTSNKVLKKAILKYKPKVIKLDSYLPASDCPPDFNGGKIKEDFKVDAIIIGSYKKEYKPYIRALYNSNLKFKIFGSGDWNIPQYLGYIPPIEICDAYASAKWSLDLEFEQNRVLAINSAGGNALSAGKWNISIEHLDKCQHFCSPEDLIEKIKQEPTKLNMKVPTLADRLKEILEVHHGNLDCNQCNV